MQKNRNKTIAIAIALFLVASMAGSTLLIPGATAHTPAWTIPTFPHIFVETDPIGVGQTAYIYLFVTPTYADTTVANDYRFHNFKLTITSPSGKVSTQTFATIMDTTSNQGTTFVPDEIGVYNLTFVYPGQNVNDYSHSPTSAYINDTYMGGTASTTMTVQQDPISAVAYPPLPTEYWTRPIFGENVAWYTISSNWLGSGMPGYGSSTGPNMRCYSGDSIGSQTSHVMWTKSIGQPGGVAGGNNLEIIGNTWFEGTAYSQRYTNPIIVAGMLVYKEPFESTGTAGDTVCVNLYTGAEIWRRPEVPALSFAYVQDMENPDFHGVRPAYLCTASFAQVYDAATGKIVWNTTGVPSGTTVVGPNGEQLRYTLFNNGTSAAPDYYLCMWNSSRFWQTGSMQQRTLQSVTTTTYSTMTVYPPQIINGVSTPVQYNISNTQVVASRGVFYEWLNPTTQNMSIPWRNTMTTTPSIVGLIYKDIILCMNGSRPSSLAPTGNLPYNYFAVNLNASKGTVGSILWQNTVQPQIDPNYGNITTASFAGIDPAGYFCESYRQTSQFAFWNLRTGAFIKMTPPPAQASLDYYGSTGSGALNNVVAFGRCYAGAYSGILYCYDMSTGNVLWTYGNGGEGNNTYSGLEVPGRYPIFVKAIGGSNLNNGIIYTVVTEHTLETPIYKNAQTRAINASDGSEIYTFTAATGEFGAGSFAIADSYTNFFNSYDSRIYTLGRGPSQTAVIVGPKSSILGGNVVIEGAVMDVSVGLKTTEIQGRFPAGVPACSDSTMKDWMAYVHQQQLPPSNFIGVNVHLVVLDANGNYQNLGTTTTDSKGQYSVSWTPNISGDFKVYAYFDGTNGYWPSNAETTFNMAPAPATATPAPTQSPSMADQYLLPGIAGIIVAIFVVGLVLALLVLRKRP
jgi:hypothetical protein